LKKDYQAELQRTWEATYAVTRHDLEMKLALGRGDWRAFVFRAALERQVELVFRLSPDQDGLLFTSIVDVERGLSAFVPLGDREGLERACTQAQRRAGIGEDLDGQPLMEVYRNRERGLLHGLAANVVGDVRVTLQRRIFRFPLGNEVNRQPIFQRRMAASAEQMLFPLLDERRPLGAFQAFVRCVDLRRRFFSTGILPLAEAQELDRHFQGRLLDGSELTQMGARFFQEIQASWLTSEDAYITELFTRVERELADPWPLQAEMVRETLPLAA
jgi:hypothetical protein